MKFNIKPTQILLTSTLVALCSYAAVPQLPMGMNVGGASYYSPSPYVDPFRTAGSFFTYAGSEWDSQKIGRVPLDSNGYPTQVPYTVDGVAQSIRSMLNTCRAGEYQLFFDGDGDISFHGAARSQVRNGNVIVTIDGSCTHGWIQMTRSNASNYMRNLRLIPVEYANNPTNVPLFDTVFVHGLKPFHSLRYMDWTSTNGSPQNTWESRAKVNHYTYGTSKGMPIEHAIQLSNLLNVHPWFCVPHNANDQFIRNFAILVRDQLKPELKAYIEYSNEVWNWQFSQAHFVGRNGLEISNGDTLQRAADTVRSQLGAVGLKYCNDANSYCHPEKDAYMMNRTFKIWKSVFGTQTSSRLVRVATAQHAWIDNTRRVLNYLFTDGDGADAISVGGYFNFEERQHNAWLAMDASQVTPQMILDSVFAIYDETSGDWTRKSAKIARQYNVDYMVYEGGQHMQPYMQGEWDYNQSVWDAQIHPKMYDLYMKNFEAHVEDTVDCKLFMAFAYTGARESRWGSWGHLENYAQSLLDSAALRSAAPKYAALLDANTPKSEGPTNLSAVKPSRLVNTSPYKLIFKDGALRVQSATKTYELSGKRLK